MRVIVVFLSLLVWEAHTFPNPKGTVARQRRCLGNGVSGGGLGMMLPIATFGNTLCVENLPAPLAPTPSEAPPVPEAPPAPEAATVLEAPTTPLPPGLQKQLDKNGALPPGLQKKINGEQSATGKGQVKEGKNKGQEEEQVAVEQEQGKAENKKGKGGVDEGGKGSKKKKE